MAQCGTLEHEGARSRPRLEVADIFRDHGEAFRQNHVLTSEQRQVMAAIETCRTKVLGGHADLCPDCGHVEISFNSCRNRHCPKCQALPQARWVAQRQERVLPVHYFHLVFTLPRELRPLVLRNRRSCFDLLFNAASATLLTLGADPKWLGGRLGITAVLHTWTRELHFHPHLHCIVTGGALGDDGRWLATKPNFLFPVRVLSALFRGKLLDGLRSLGDQGKLDLTSLGDSSQEATAFAKIIDGLYCKDWVVYAKRPFGGPNSVFEYLGRYTHRVAISNARLIAFEDGRVTFATKNCGKVTVTAETFIRRFLLHVLPKGFVKIRHYGLLSPCHAKTTLEQARVEIETTTATAPEQNSADLDPSEVDEHDNPCGQKEQPLVGLEWVELLRRLTGRDVTVCPRCGAKTIRLGLNILDVLHDDDPGP